ncbi:spore germination protein [Clostridium sp. D2Q-14]|uniref:spore germination protein n=1 Tax=Anaeromonas gelatinilytica TaxID=2683194 RepID=UPI00193C37B5|nr:spore germination protein [Anaeromonas gelatinilytica]MBS4535139.1 spore germination protein [Anaeromonas gelatinilytica]
MKKDEKENKNQDQETVEIPISKDIDHNLNKIKEILSDCDDVIYREFSVGKKQNYRFAIIYIDGLTDKKLVSEYVLEALMHEGRDEVPNPRMVGTNLYKLSKEGNIPITEVEDLKCLKKSIDAVLIGETIVLVDGFKEILMISSRGWPLRSITEPVTESVARGPRDGFNETSKVNTSLIRRRIRDPRLKLKYKQIGTKSKTDIAIMYLDKVVNNELLKEVNKRLDDISIDAILESSFIEQLIEDNWKSPFPQLQSTERPDRVAAAIYEGKIAIVVDNTPFVLILPATWNALLQSAEDYYDRWVGAFIVRLVRYLAIPLSLLLPAFYIAVTTYHPGILPTQLVLYLAATRINVPFPAFIEAFIMEITLEILRESGTRISGPIGTTIGIVGGLVIGEAAVQAGIVSPFMIIIVALTTISSFALPNFAIASGLRFCRFIIMLLATVLGLYGIVLGLVIIIAHLCSLKSFGIPYMEPYSNIISSFRDFKDSIIRVPQKFMRLRPEYLNIKNRVRMSSINEIDSTRNESVGDQKDDRGK